MTPAQIAENMQREINGSISDILKPHTLAFGLWKLRLRHRIHQGGEMHLFIDWEGSVNDEGVFHTACFLLFAHYLKFKWFPANQIILLARLPHIVRARYNPLALIKPKYWHKVGDHYFLINRREKKSLMRAILLDYLMKKEYEKETTKVIQENVRAGDVALDIGASIGAITMLLARQVGNFGKVIAVEPTNFQFPYLLANIKKNGYQDIVIPRRCGAWDKDEQVQIPLCAAEQNKVKIEGRSMASLLNELRIGKVDFIKIDTDGAEPWVLRGLIPVFEKNKNLKMIVEYYPKYVKDAGSSIEEVMAILDKYFTYSKVDGEYEDHRKGYEHYNLFCTRKI